MKKASGMRKRERKMMIGDKASDRRDGAVDIVTAISFRSVVCTLAPAVDKRGWKVDKLKLDATHRSNSEAEVEI